MRHNRRGAPACSSRAKAACASRAGNSWRRAGLKLCALALTPVDRRERFLYHKTTRRGVYESRRAERPGLFDVLLRNERGELTEFTNGNLVVELEGRRWTPPRELGLLAGTLRGALLRAGEISERVLTEGDLARASRVWLVNGVRGWVEVTFDGPCAGAGAKSNAYLYDKIF